MLELERYVGDPVRASPSEDRSPHRFQRPGTHDDLVPHLSQIGQGERIGDEQLDDVPILDK